MSLFILFLLVLSIVFICLAYLIGYQAGKHAGEQEAMRLLESLSKDGIQITLKPQGGPNADRK